jgi:hypothetical protein
VDGRLRLRSYGLTRDLKGPTSTRTKIVLLFVIGASVREGLAPFTGHPFDFELWIRLGYYTAQGLDPYRITGPVPNLSMPGAGNMTSLGYPPVWPFVLAALYKLYALTGVSNRFFYYLILKQPMIIGDLLDGLIIYKIVKQKSETKALKALAFWLLCPFIILISAVWGMFDQLVLVFVLVSVFWSTRTKTTAVAEGVGILLKAIPLIYLPSALSQLENFCASGDGHERCEQDRKQQELLGNNLHRL